MGTRLLKIFALLLVVVHQINCTDYYKVLELNRDATEQDIQRAFRRLSLKYHPDKNPGDQEAAQRFLDINKAKEILGDADKRRIYDSQGQEALDRHIRGDDVDMWGNRQRGPNAYSDVPVTLEELYNGADKEMTYSRNVICSSCRGTGAKDGQTKTCPHCNGAGVKLERVSMGPGFSMQMQTTCNACGGRGKTHAAHCPICKGRRVKPEQKTLKFEIEKGMKDGQNLVFARESEQSPDYTPGDLILVLKQSPHKMYKRIGDNLYYECNIELKEALLGFKRSIKHLDDHYTQIASNEIVQPFSVKIIKEEGMPIHSDPGSYGDMHVKYIVKLPKKLSKEDKEQLKKIFELDS
jgi:DnaJ-related protein SCJ1